MDNGQNGPNGKNDENNDGKKNGELKMSVIICMILVFAIVILFAYVRDKISETQNVEISYGEFLEKLEKGKLESVVIEGDRLILTPKESKDKDKISDEPMTYYTGIIEDPQLVERLNKAYKNKLVYIGELPYVNTVNNERGFPFIKQCSINIPNSFGVCLL